MNSIGTTATRATHDGSGTTHSITCLFFELSVAMPYTSPSASIALSVQVISVVAALWGLLGFSGVAYSVIVARRMRKQAAYRPQLEDWLFHVVLPLAAYATLALSPFAAASGG